MSQDHLLSNRGIQGSAVVEEHHGNESEARSDTHLPTPDQRMLQRHEAYEPVTDPESPLRGLWHRMRSWFQALHVIEKVSVFVIVAALVAYFCYQVSYVYVRCSRIQFVTYVCSIDRPLSEWHTNALLMGR